MRDLLISGHCPLKNASGPTVQAALVKMRGQTYRKRAASGRTCPERFHFVPPPKMAADIAFTIAPVTIENASVAAIRT
ncbi:MAG: hypothetical protein P4L33_03350 [Capsulimonadaceae bacterium]|nr:hypothetical protein [Capsulimonadaceae bacterium]